MILLTYYYHGYNSNNCIERNFCLTNLSLSNKYKNPYSCRESNSITIPFHANRKLINNPNFVVVTIYMYPSVNKIYNYFKFIQNFTLSNNGEVLLLVSFNISLYKFLKSSNRFTEIIKRKKILLYLQKLDKGYSLFKYKYNKSYCYLFYTNIQQYYFSNDFLSHTYPINFKMWNFSGYYAAGTNLYSVIPYMLKIFDYFDYYFKYDFDQPGSINIKEFAFGNYIKKKWYLFGTLLNLDFNVVCTNVKKMILDFVEKKRCSKNVISAIKSLTNECIQFQGFFTGMWLGLYSSIEMKEFSNFYITYKEGIKKYRWGDQQFFVNSLLLFSGRSKIYYNLSYI